LALSFLLAVAKTNQGKHPSASCRICHIVKMPPLVLNIQEALWSSIIAST
jgi:hypothetical protein